MGFADIGLAYQFAVGLGGVITVTFLVAMVRLYWKKRKLSRNQMKRDLEAAEKATQKANVQEKILEEGDYFGVRAIEQGYYGGVAQSPPITAPNSPRLSTVPAMVDCTGSPAFITPSRGSSISEFSLAGRRMSRAPSSATSLKTDAPIRSPRLQPSDAELSGRRNHDPIATMSTYVPTSPISLSTLEASAESGLDPESVSIAPAPSNMRPTLNRQVQSYAQWRLSADLRNTTRAKNKVSGMRSRDGSDNNGYTHPQTGRRRSRSASTVELINQLRSLQQEIEALKAAGSLDAPLEPSSSVCQIGNEVSQQSSRRRTRSQPAACDHRHPSKGATRSVKRARDSMRRTQKFSTKPGAQKRRSRQRNKMNHDPSLYIRSDSESALPRILDPDNSSSLLSGGRAYEERYGSRNSLISGSITRSRSSSNASSTSSTKSTANEAPEDRCEVCRRDSQRGHSESTANQPTITLSMPR